MKLLSKLKILTKNSKRLLPPLIFVSLLSAPLFCGEEVQEIDASLQLIQKELVEAARRPPYTPLDIPGAERPEVEKIRSLYLSPKYAKRLSDDLERAQDYRIYVRKAVIDNNLPLVIEYLPMIESNYKPNARSKSGAIGVAEYIFPRSPGVIRCVLICRHLMSIKCRCSILCNPCKCTIINDGRRHRFTYNFSQ